MSRYQKFDGFRFVGVCIYMYRFWQRIQVRGLGMFWGHMCALNMNYNLCTLENVKKIFLLQNFRASVADFCFWLLHFSNTSLYSTICYFFIFFSLAGKRDLVV